MRKKRVRAIQRATYQHAREVNSKQRSEELCNYLNDLLIWDMPLLRNATGPELARLFEGPKREGVSFISSDPSLGCLAGLPRHSPSGSVGGPLGRVRVLRWKSTSSSDAGSNPTRGGGGRPPRSRTGWSETMYSLVRSLAMMEAALVTRDRMVGLLDSQLAAMLRRRVSGAGDPMWVRRWIGGFPCTAVLVFGLRECCGECSCVCFFSAGLRDMLVAVEMQENSCVHSCRVRVQSTRAKQMRQKQKRSLGWEWKATWNENNGPSEACALTSTTFFWMTTVRSAEAFLLSPRPHLF